MSREILKTDDEAAPSKKKPTEITPVVDHRKRSDEEQAEMRAKRAAAKQAKKDADRARRAQSAASRHRA